MFLFGTILIGVALASLPVAYLGQQFGSPETAGWTLTLARYAVLFVVPGVVLVGTELYRPQPTALPNTSQELVVGEPLIVYRIGLVLYWLPLLAASAMVVFALCGLESIMGWIFMVCKYLIFLLIPGIYLVATGPYRDRRGRAI